VEESVKLGGEGCAKQRPSRPRHCSWIFLEFLST
jgi:hypothetical protein